MAFVTSLALPMLTALLCATSKSHGVIVWRHHGIGHLCWNLFPHVRCHTARRKLAVVGCRFVDLPSRLGEPLSDVGKPGKLTSKNSAAPVHFNTAAAAHTLDGCKALTVRTTALHLPQPPAQLEKLLHHLGARCIPAETWDCQLSPFRSPPWRGTRDFLFKCFLQRVTPAFNLASLSRALHTVQSVVRVARRGIAPELLAARALGTQMAGDTCISGSRTRAAAGWEG